MSELVGGYIVEYSPDLTGPDSVDEGSTASFVYYTTENLIGTTLDYSISTIKADWLDFVGFDVNSDNPDGSRNFPGTVDVISNPDGPGGVAYIDIGITSEFSYGAENNVVLYEGPETFTLSIGSESKTVTINDTFTTGITEPTLFTENGHYYQFVTFDESFYVGTEIGVPPTLPSTNLWQSAVDLAATYTHNGIQGHLATITSAEENEFVRNIVGDNAAYLGAHDSEEQGVFKWVTGPEAGLTVTETGYTNWWPGEPSNNHFGGEPSFSGEDALTMSNNNKWNGQWWDGQKYLAGGTESRGFLVEYSAPLPPESSLSSVIVAEGKSGVDFSDTNGNGLIDFNFDGGPYLVRVNFDQPITVGSQYADNHLDLSADGIGFDFITADSGSMSYEPPLNQYFMELYHTDQTGTTSWKFNQDGSLSEYSGHTREFNEELDAIDFWYQPLQGASTDTLSFYLDKDDAPNFSIYVENSNSDSFVPSTPEIPTVVPVESSDGTLFVYGGHTYQYVASHDTWHDAKNAADTSTIFDGSDDRSGYLVTIDSAEENAFVVAVGQHFGEDYFWLNLTDQNPADVWFWSMDYQNPPETVNIATSIEYDNFRTDFDLSAGDYAAIVTGYDHYPDNVGEWMYSIYGQAYIIEYDATVSIGGDNTNTGGFVMPTTSDLTLRVDGEQVDST